MNYFKTMGATRSLYRILLLMKMNTKFHIYESRIKTKNHLTL